MRNKDNGNIIFGKCAKLVALITRSPYLGERVYLKSLLYTLVFLQENLLSEWNVFYPLDKNNYYGQDGLGEVLTMPAAVEVTVCGVRSNH